MSDTRGLERWWSEVNAKAVLAIRYPSLWAAAFLDVVLIERGMRQQMSLQPWCSIPMAFVFDLLGVATGNNLVDAWAGRSSKWYRGWSTGLFVAFGAANAVFVVSTADPSLMTHPAMRMASALTLPAMGVVGVLSGAVQAWRQVTKDDQALARAEAKAAKEEAKAAKLAEELARANQQAVSAGQVPVWADPSVAKVDRVRAWLVAHPGQSLRQGADDTGIPWSTFQGLAKQVVGIDQSGQGGGQ